MSPRTVRPFVLTLDLVGTTVFAIEGATAAILGGLDLFGVLALAFVTAFGGGILRDLLIGDVLPMAIRDYRYALLAFAGGTVTFLFYGLVSEVPPLVLAWIDAAGLSLFAIAGTEKALDFKIHPVIAALMGVLTAVGGGTWQQVLLNHVPPVLRADIYASAALAGAVAMLALRRVGVAPGIAALIGGVLCFVVRLLSIQYHWSLPHLHG